MKVIIIFCIMGTLLFGCGGGKEQHGTSGDTSDFEQSIADFKNFTSQPFYEKSALLSAKYSIAESTVIAILDEYLSKHDPAYQLWREVFGDSNEATEQETRGAFEVDLNFQKTINELSARYGIPRSELAKLIIDYKIWNECEVREGNIYWGD